MVLAPDGPFPNNIPDNRSVLRLGEQTFYTSAPINIDPASDFAQGIKTGPTSFDERLHSFFIAIDDNSGGMGYDKVDIREDVGVYNLSALGADTRKSKHLHAPPYLHRLVSWPNSSIASAWQFNRNPSCNANSILQFKDRIVIAFPGFVAYSTDGVQWKKVALTNKAGTKLINAFMGDAGKGYFVFNEQSTLIPDTGGTYSTDGLTWTDVDNFPLWDVFFSRTYNKFILLSDTNIDDSAAWPTAAIAAGNLPAGQGFILGEMTSPYFGYVGVYFVKNGSLYYWTSDSGGIERITEAQLGSGFNVGGGCFFNGSLYIHDGQSVKSYTASNQTELIRDVGFQTFRSIPSNIRAGRIRAMCSDEAHIYAAVQVDSDVYVLAYNGRGWNVQGKIPDFYIQSMSVARFPATTWPSTKRSLYFVGGTEQAFSQIVRPNGNGADTAWTGDYTDVDEEEADEATTDINSANLNDRESFTMQDVGANGLVQGDGVTIIGIRVVARVKRAGASASNILLYYNNGANQDGTGQVVSSSTYHNKTQDWTGLSLTVTDVNGYEYGIKKNNDADDVSCTQFYVQYTYGGNAELWEMHLPASGSVPTIGEDRFAYQWDLTTAWMNGAFIDLRGALYSLLMTGELTATEYVKVYYSIDQSETETLLCTITEDGQKFYWSEVHNEGVSFRTFRLRLHGYNGAPEESVADSNQDQDHNLGNAVSAARVAQGFKLDVAAKIDNVKLYMRNFGTPSNSVHECFVEIRADNAGVPATGTPLAVSAVYTDIATFMDSNYGWRTFKFDLDDADNFASGALSAATQYWFVVRNDSNLTGNPWVDASNYIQIGRDASSPPYADGQTANYNSSNSTWTAANYDFIFEVVPDRRVAADIRGYVINYNKRPKYRAQFAVQIDVGGMIEDGILVDGVPASFENVYAKAVELWNQEELIHYEIPGVRDGHCMIAAMPVNVSDVIVDGVPQGNLGFQILEPTQSHSVQA